MRDVGEYLVALRATLVFHKKVFHIRTQKQGAGVIKSVLCCARDYWLVPTSHPVTVELFLQEQKRKTLFSNETKQF